MLGIYKQLIFNMSNNNEKFRFLFALVVFAFQPTIIKPT